MVAGSDAGRALGVLGVVCLLHCFGFISCFPQQIYGVVNGSVTFHVPSNVPLKEVLWKKQKDKVAELENSEFRAFSSFKNRVYLDTVSGSLTIYNLTSSDEDEYEMESPNITDTMKFFLYVLESLPSPTLTCALTNGSIEVQCMIPEHYNSHRGLIIYSWDCPMEQCKRNSTSIYFKMENDLPQKIQCTLSNPLFNKTSSISLTTCIPSSGHSRHRYALIPVPLAVITTCIVLYMNESRYVAQAGLELLDSSDLTASASQSAGITTEHLLCSRPCAKCIACCVSPFSRSRPCAKCIACCVSPFSRSSYLQLPPDPIQSCHQVRPLPALGNTSPCPAPLQPAPLFLHVL
ncbi:lymphocyte function-associated antigen 3 isoform X4 [Pan troglodytes]|uniref:lymphocyte function-associated antigen 3 isoform X4 n=1 Tax=Pan troglodytes TaxID=9598 RepID=UPI0030133B2F